jgi:hypothetical protein
MVDSISAVTVDRALSTKGMYAATTCKDLRGTVEVEEIIVSSLVSSVASSRAPASRM